MATGKVLTIRQRRKREGKTNYKKRLNLLKSKKSRVIIRKFNKNMIAQIVEYKPKGDVVSSSAYSRELEKYGWKYSKNNTPAAYLLGLLLSKKAKAKEAILDIGLHSPTKGAKLFACLKGCVDGGLKIPLSEESLPSDVRISGKHISDYSSKIDKKAYDIQFSGYKKKKVDPKNIEKNFIEVKEKIMKGK
ncbi:50S ribosomal protein L18 [Candidatus Woesearchaeota archaeon]|nr:50S ribosomal protein L18 [Candidatus Woesearchaeota archaeon]